jgi:N-acylneuraminate cytidylyltransferase
MRTLGIIPARGGSKGLPGKNTRPLAGRPLLEWTVRAARNSGRIDRLVLSTDDASIAAAGTACACEVPFLRPAQLAADDTPMIDVVLHALDVLCDEIDLVVLLQPTSPLRSGHDIAACVDLCVQTGAPSVVAVTPATESPYWMFTMGPGLSLARLLPEAPMRARRQDLPAAYRVNGAVYVARPDWLRRQRAFMAAETKGYVMPAERSVDIDNLDDWEMAEAVFRRMPLSDERFQ